VRVPRTWFCPLFHGARHVSSMTAVGRFFPCVQLQPVHGSVYGSVYVRVPRTWFCPVFHGARHVSSMTAVGRFFPCPHIARSRVRVRVRVRACASYMVLPTFPWRASRSVHDGRRPFFPRVHVQPVHGSVRGSVYGRVPRTWFCPVFHGARHVSSMTAVGRFFPCPRTARSRVRVRACASYVVLPSFPWRASRFVHDGRRPFFPVSTYSPFTGPCKGPCTCVCLVRGFAQFSMARVTFRPRRPSAVFSRVHVQPVHGSV